jgi:type II secretory pathway component PulK
LKYIGLYASPQVNVNTAPRHVLEAALTFGGLTKAPDIADAIIQKRKIEPFTDIEDLKKALFGSADAIDKCAPYITTKSTYFTIHVTATSGAARVSTLMPVYKDGRILKRLPVING